MRIAITGANGFVGKAMVRVAITQGHSVRSIVRKPTGLPNERIVGDISVETIDPTIFTDIDAVIHLVARTHITGESADASSEAYRLINVVGTQKALEAAAAAGVKYFVYISSVKAAAESTEIGQALTSEFTPNPKDAYGKTKLEAEQLVQKFCEENRMNWVILRPPLVYGPGVEANFARLIACVARGVPLPLRGVKNRRSIVYVDNLADASIRSLSEIGAQNKIVMLCDNTLSTADLLRAIAYPLVKPARLFLFPETLFRILRYVPKMQPLLDRLTGSLEIDPAPAMRLLNWTPSVSIGDGMQQTVAQWLADNKGR